MDIVDPAHVLGLLGDRDVEVDDDRLLPLRTKTHSSGSRSAALISWCGTYGGTK